MFKGHYDTTTGPKQEADSYRRIASEFGIPANSILFVSDVAAELDAAAQAGFQTVLSLRDGNKPVENASSYASINGFDEIELTGSEAARQQ